MPSHKLVALALAFAACGLLQAAEPRKPTPSPRPYSVVEAVIDERGKVESAKIVKSGGVELDRQALEFVRSQNFKPVMKDGKPVKAFLTLSVLPHPEL